jgi:hypothetical protein
LLVGIMALSAVVAGNASAERPHTKLTTVKSSWKGANGAAFTTAKAVTCTNVGTLTLKSTVLGSPTTLTASGVSCVSASLENTTVEGVAMAVGHGKLKFTGVKVTEPAGCSVAETLETEELEIALDHHDIEKPEGSGTFETTLKPFITFRPKGEKFISIKITGCSIAGTYPVKGFTTATAANDTGVKASPQLLKFNTESNEAGELKLGTEPATITGEANNSVGEEFSASE